MHPYLPLLGTGGIPDRVLWEAATPMVALVILAVLGLAALAVARWRGEIGRSAGHQRRRK